MIKVLSFLILMNFSFARICRGLNIGKNNNTSEVMNNGILSNDFHRYNPLHTHRTYSVKEEDTDYFYIRKNGVKPKISKVWLTHTQPKLMSAAYRLDTEKIENVLSIIYMCNPMIPLKVNFTVTLHVEKCGYIHFSWIKICGDLMLPMLGLTMEMKRRNGY